MSDDFSIREAIVAVVGLALAAFCLWLGVRICTRRERWAKRTAVVLAAFRFLYVLSSGPTQIIAFRQYMTISHLGAGTYNLSPMRLPRGAWWVNVYAPLNLMSDYPWGEPLNWYWDLFPIPEAGGPPIDITHSKP